MPVITVTTEILAPIERCFDLARSIDLHVQSTKQTRERAVGGVVTGLIGLNEEVTWEATHFGVQQRLTSRITAYDRPRHFRDSMVRGVFTRFDHDHFFTHDRGITTMTDVFDYGAPLGMAGEIANFLFLKSYLRRFLRQRGVVIRSVAESAS